MYKFKLEALTKTTIIVFNAFCLVPFSFPNNDGTVQYNKFKILLFMVILTGFIGFEGFEILSHTFGGPPPPPPEHSEHDHPPHKPPPQPFSGILKVVTDVRVIYYSLHLLGITLNAVLNQPRCLVRCFTLCQLVNKHLPISFKLWQIIAWAVCAGVTCGLDCWLFINFRFRDGFPDGPPHIVIRTMIFSIYAHALCVASDILFLVLTVVNHFYYQRVIRALKEGTTTLALLKVFLNVREMKHQELTVVQLRELFGHICDIKQSINEGFTIQLFFTAVRAFVDNISGIFMAIAIATTSNESSYNTKTNQYHYAWCAFLLLKILLTTTMAHKLSTDTNETAMEVHRRLNFTPDYEDKLELVAFSLEVGHRTKEPFTAMNLFVIDYTFFKSIIGTISTYLIILLQFRESTIDDSEAQPNTQTTFKPTV